MHLKIRRFIVAAATLIVGCESAPEFYTTNTTPQTALRAEAVGCWALSELTDDAARPLANEKSQIVRIDSAEASLGSRGARAIQRIDSRGGVVLEDAEGFKFQDAWTADSVSDSIRLTFNNGLYGSHWAFALPKRNIEIDTMRGRTTEFGDTYPPENYPARLAVAMRILCSTSTR